MSRHDADGPFGEESLVRGDADSPRPFLGVDVDGVLNLSESPPDMRAALCEMCTRADGLTIPVPLGTANRLARLSDVFEMVWATAWGQNAYTALREILSLDRQWPIIDLWSHHVPDSVATWKLPAIERWLDVQAATGSWLPWPGPPFAWLDDDLEDDAIAWAEARSQSIPTLLIRVDPRTGLTDDHVQHLLEWAHGASPIHPVERPHGQSRS